MDAARFWLIVSALGPELVPARLATALTSLSPADLDGFCDRLADVEDELDTTEHRASAHTAYELDRYGVHLRAWTTREEQPPAEFDELQATVVAHGLDAWRAVVAVPPLLSGGWPTGLGRQLLLAVADAERRACPDPATA